MHEIEVKFTDINVKDIRNKLKKIGAKLVHKTLLFKRYVFLLPNNKNGFIRIRDEVLKKTMTVKTYNKSSKYANELEIEFLGEFDEAKKILEALNLELKAYQETMREKWIYKDCSEIVIDTIPGIPTYIEIECDSENIVKNVSKKLGLNFNEGKYGAYALQYFDYYDIPKDVLNNVVPRLSFTNMIEDLTPYIKKNKELLIKMQKKQIKKYNHAIKRNNKKK